MKKDTLHTILELLKLIITALIGFVGGTVSAAVL